MKDLKIKVNNKAESKEAQELLFELGASLGNGDRYAVMVQGAIGLAVINGLINFVFNEIVFFDIKRCKEVTLQELRSMVNQEQDEPFLTPECTLNDQYAEIEQVRQAVKVKSGSDSDHMADAMSYGLMGIKQDNINHPSHYTQGKVECIDALESATIGKSGIEAVCVANIIKYLWRYEEKNGLEDIKKAQFYLNRLIATLENNNG